jgi:hypothetical protein
MLRSFTATRSPALAGSEDGLKFPSGNESARQTKALKIVNPFVMATPAYALIELRREAPCEDIAG